MECPIEWPAINDGFKPQWTGQEFIVDSSRTSVLCYHAARSGWSEELTSFHEESAGSHHYMDRASRKCAIQSLGAVLSKRAPVVLEIGCSSGYFLAALKEQAPHAFVIGADYIADPLFQLSARLPGVPLLQFDLTRCPFEESVFDAIVALNVLEHIEDDELALKKVYRMLKPGGVAVIEVPAAPHLFDYYDSHLMHFRRYALKPLVELAQDTGFHIQRASHLGCFLYPAFAITKKMNQRNSFSLSNRERQRLVSQDIQTGAGNPLLHGLMNLELTLGRYIRYPFGIRCLVVAEKS
jgi:SAM-dependent methyltransferase